MQKTKKKSFDWYGMRQHFSIRKYHFGAASVLLGMSLALGAGAQVAQAEATVASSEATTATIASSTDSSASSEAVATEATVASTTETSVSAAETATSTSTETVASTTETVTSTTESSVTTERTATINYIVQYVLEDGTLVKADVKTTSVTTTEATAKSTVEVATELPLGYELATGQAAKVSQEVTENGENIVTVKVVKKAEEKAATTSETTTSATKTATEETTTPATATVTETVKTPATVEEAKVVLEQVTSEAEVLANEAERLVAAADSDNTALKAAAAATKLTATEATAVLNDSAATLEAVNAQIDAVRTNVEALALELRKFLGTDAIEIALNTSVSNLNVTEGEGILVGTTSTATPTMDDPHGASVGRHSLPTGVATTEDGWFTFAVYDLRSYNTNQAGSVVGGSAVPAYIRYSLDKDPTTATVLAELVSTTDGRVLEKVTIEPGAEVALSYPTTVDAKNEPVKLVYDTSEAVEGGVSGTIQFSAQDKNSGNFGSYSTTYVPPYVVNTTRYVTENGDLIATYNVQTISGQPVTSSGQREFTGVEYVSQSIEVADSIYPKGSKSVATTYDLGNAVKVKVIREVVDHGKMTLTFYVTDPSYTKPYDLVTTDTTGFLPVFQTSELTHRVGDKYVYNHSQNFIGNYLIDPDDPTGSRKIYAVSAPNDQGSMYRIVANFSGDNSTDGTPGRLYLSSEVWSTKEKATNGEDIGGFAWRTGLGADKFVDKGYTPGGRQNILRVGTLASANQITYVYRALEQEAIIRYQVEGATDYLEESAIQTGGSGSDINYSTEDTINKYKKLGYTLVSDNFTTDAGQDYDYDTAVRQEFLVVIKPRVEEVPNTAVPGKPVDPTDPNSPVWPDSINNLETTQEVTRKVEYKYEDGTPVRVDAAGNILPKGSEGTPLVKTETVTFTRPAQVNLVTGEVTYGEWAADSTDVLNGNLIPEIKDYTAKRTTLEGADAPMTESVTDKTVAATDADINEVVFYTPNPKYGDVVVNYVNTDRKVIATPVVDTNDALVGTDYSTADQVPAKIVEDATGDVYYYKEIKAEDAAKETGKVVEGTTEVTYVYEKAGDVVIKYVDVNGLELKAPVSDTTDGKPGSDYNTAEGTEKPATITTADGKVYKLAPAATYKVGTVSDDNNLTSGATPTGTVEAGVTKEVTYVYKLVEGDVIVHYVDTEGNTIADDVTDTQITDTGTDYDTTDNKPNKIVNDKTGDVYYILPTDEVKAGDKETGKVVEGTTEVTYIYQKAGNVVVNYTLADGTVIKDPVNDETNQEPGYDYNTTDNKPETITTTDGKVYKLVPTATIGNENGDVEAGKTIEVTYIYEEVKSDVVVEYYDTEGNPISGTETGNATSVEDTKDASVGTDYNTDDKKPETITAADGTVYYYKEVKDTSKPTTGKVAETTTTVQYVYEKAGDVVVNYITEDGTPLSGTTNTGATTASTVDDTKDGKPGSTYDTTDLKPTTITTDDGKTYELVPASTVGDETGTVEAGVTKEVTYVYKEVKGSVVVNYISTTGEELQAQVVDTPESSTGTGYDTTDVKPETITTKDGRTFKLVPKMTQGSETGDVVPGVTEVTYVYEEVKGDVVVNYVNTEGKVIASQVVDTKTTSTGTDYDTTDNKPEKIVEDATGDVYYILPTDEVKAGDKETGKVVEGTTEVTYIYQKAGNVVVNYTLADGTVIKDPVNDETNQKPGTEYNTTDNKPETITTTDGKVYKLVPAATIGNETGDVEAGKTIEVTYIYEEVKSDVVVEYYNTAGEVIAKTVVDEDDKSVGTVYNTDEDNKPEKITTEDGTVYYYKEVKDSSAPTTGKVAETTTTVQYVYEKAGNVVVNYITEDGTVIKDPVNDETNAAPGSDYNTTDNKPTTITTKDGKTYELIPTATIGNETGDVEAGKTTEVTYVYKEVKGSVVVNYVTTDGTVLQAPVTDTPETSTGTPYDTTDVKPGTITTADGKTYKLVPSLTQGSETGDVVPGVTEVTYVYEEVKGDVVVNYVNTDGKVIASQVVDTKTTSTGTDYDTTDNKPAKITTEDGTVYYYKEVDATSATETGKVVEGTTEITYVYEQAGSVTVNYVTTDGTVIKSPVKDEENAEPGKTYSTEDNKPTTITTEDGKTYKLVPNVTTGEENGTITSGEDKQVTYVYEEVKGNVVVEYYNTAGEKIATDVEDTPASSTGTAYTTLDNKPETITATDGTVYYYKEVKADSAAETGDVVEGTTTVKYVYEQAGNVVVNYITEDGTPIKTPVNDETNAAPGSEYNTTDNKPTTITTEDGKTYELIPTATIGTEEGTVEAGKTTEVTYVYKEVKGSVVVNYVTTDGTVIQAPVTDTPETSTGTPYDTKDNKPTTITKDGKTYKLVPTLTKGSETGDVVPGVTQVTYVYEEVKGDVVVNYVNTDGKVIATPVVDTKTTSTGTAYDTTDNKPTKIVEDSTGDVYYYKEVQVGSNETGTVVEGTTEVTYVYEKAGNVVVNYITEDGTVIKTPVKDEENAEPGKSYDTTDNKPTTITTEDGTTYELVPSATIGTENGEVESGKTTEVTYVYRKVETPAAKTGNVVVEYYNTAGEKIATDVVDTPETTTGTVYETFDFKPATITKDGVTYLYKEVKDTSAAEKGTVIEGTTTVQYVYEPAGSVTVNYVTTDGTVIKTPVKDEENAEPGKSYSTEDNKPTTITTEDGKTYKLVPSLTTGEENGSVTPGEDKQVTYVYEEVKGDVVVNYIDTEGNVIKAPVTDTPSTSTGTSYDTTDNKPTTITTEDGTEYKLVPVLTKGEENGSVVEGTTQVTYVYQKVTTPAPKPNGSVVVNYVNTNGETIATSVNDTTDAALDTTYDTTDFKPAVIKHNGVTYFYKEVKAGDNESGKVVEGTTEVTYVYEPAGSVTVNYVTTDGTVIKSPVKDEENAEPGKTYSTEDNKPTTITTEDGKTYKLVPSLTTGEENGSVTPGEDKQVTYVYEEVKGNVLVNYIDTEGNVIAARVEDTSSTSTGTSYDTTDNKPTTITIADGSVYELVPVLTQGNENGSVVEGTTEVTYVYRKVTPAKKVVTKHVDENGNPIAPQEDGTTPNKSIPGYEFTGKTITDENGNTTHVYRKVKAVVTNHVDENGNPIAPQEDGTTPDKSIPGYEFTGKTITDENGNTTHIYRKIPANPTTPVTPVPSAPAKPGQPATPKAGKAQLPNTGETSSATGVLGVAMLVAALAIAGKRRRNED